MMTFRKPPLTCPSMSMSIRLVVLVGTLLLGVAAEIDLYDVYTCVRKIIWTCRRFGRLQWLLTSENGIQTCRLFSSIADSYRLHEAVEIC